MDTFKCVFALRWEIPHPTHEILIHYCNSVHEYLCRGGKRDALGHRAARVPRIGLTANEVMVGGGPATCPRMPRLKMACAATRLSLGARQGFIPISGTVSPKELILS